MRLRTGGMPAQRRAIEMFCLLRIASLLIPDGLGQHIDEPLHFTGGKRRTHHGTPYSLRRRSRGERELKAESQAHGQYAGTRPPMLLEPVDETAAWWDTMVC